MLRILTVRQPWASLIIEGHKPVENRPWRTSYRGDVAVLAGKTLDVSERANEACNRYMASSLTPSAARADANRLPMGGVIGLVELWGETREMDSWWFTGPAGLLLRNARSLDEVYPKAGSLCLATASEQEELNIRSRLRP